MDEFTYDYVPGTNRLDHVDDAVNGSSYGTDLDDQDASNYVYYQDGSLQADAQAEIDRIVWNVQNKVRHVRRTPGSDLDNLEFRYNAAGNRAVKVVKPRISGDPSAETNWTYTYYIHDAQGNPMAMYTRRTLTSPNTQDEFALSELPLYGGARLGTAATDRAYTLRFNGTSGTSTAVSSTQVDGESTLGRAYVYTMPDPGDGHDTYPIQLQAVLGKKAYELTNHLSNVLATVGDRRVAVLDDDVVDHYMADVQSYADYYPFGSLLPGRYGGMENQRFGFQGQEKDDQMHDVTGASYAFEYRTHDARIGRFLSIDPLSQQYPHSSPYAFAENKVIQFIELEGLETAPSKAGSEGQTATTYERYLCKECDGEHVYNWIYHEGGVEGSEAGWRLRDDYWDDVTKPLAKSYIAWEDGTGDGNLWSGFSVAHGGGWGEAIKGAAVHYRANPTFDGWQSYIPLWGSANQAALDFGVGKNGSGAFQTAMAISDIFLLKSLLTAGLKGGLGGMLRGGGAWSSTRAYYGRTKYAPPGIPLHHWRWARDGQKSGVGLSWRLKNQMWNLIPVKKPLLFNAITGFNLEGWQVHQLVHGKTLRKGFSSAGYTWNDNFLGQGLRLHYGTPTWLKASPLSIGGRAIDD